MAKAPPFTKKSDGETKKGKPPMKGSGPQPFPPPKRKKDK